MIYEFFSDVKMYAQVFNYIFKATSSISYEEDMKQYQSGLVWFIYSSSLLHISYLSLHLLSRPPPPHGCSDSQRLFCCHKLHLHLVAAMNHMMILYLI